MATLRLKPKEDRRIRAGHLWVFSNEIADVCDFGENGDLVDVLSDRGKFLGRAYYNKHSLIAARILTDRKEEIDTAFLVRKLQAALAYRQQLFGVFSSGRVVFSEGDLLPGLIVDKYDNCLVVQILTLGMERLRASIVEALLEVFGPEGILLRNDSSYRQLETLPESVDAVYGAVPERIEIEESGARFVVDPYHGQKTGFFFDQRDTRAIVRQLARDRRTLDCFCYSGGFAVNAALGGASSVVAADSSQSALELLGENAELNGVADKITATREDCFDLLRRLSDERGHFDLIILDPPAFVKSKSQLKAAVAGYREINMSAMKLLSPGGILVTCSCSQNLSVSAFQELLRSAARDAHVRFRQRAFLTQSADHPILQAMPETQYLKCFVLERL
ncbi:MAG: class I SAM-dependent rRNA methyltransferase [Candidatus Zixiibacteriota bacterium]